MPNDLSNTSWSEIDASNNAAVPNGWPAGMFPNQVEPTAQATMGGLKRFWNRVNGFYTSSYAGGVYVVTPATAMPPGNPAYPTTYGQGERYTFKANQNSNGGDSFQISNSNSLPAWPIYKASSLGAVAIAANDILAGMVELFFDGALNGGAGGFWLGTAPASSLGAPSGTVADFAGINAPSGWLLCYGQAVSRTTYSTLFAAIAIGAGGTITGNITSGSSVIPGVTSTTGMVAGMPISGTGIPSGTTIASVDSGTQIHISQNANSGSGAAVPIVVAPHGIGDGSTTFNVPDLRGRASHGVDNMGGTAANLVTSGVSGINGVLLGAAGGNQNLHAHSHGVSDPSHAHGVYDPSHYHTPPGGQVWQVTNASGANYSGGPDNNFGYEGNTAAAYTGIGIYGAYTGISLGTTGSGASQNMPPSLMLNKIIKT
jgi:microcystin-dependent protein